MIFADRPWAKTIGFLITIISLVITIYVSFIYKKAPNYKYDIISQTSILANHTEVPYIKIFVDSIDIHHRRENISIVEIRVSNTGKSPLRRDDYDLSDFGLRILNGSLIGKPELINSSNEHINYCLRLHEFNDCGSFINLPIMPLDSKDFYQFKSTIIHKDNESVQLKPLGKIIGQGVIEISVEDKNEKSFLARMFDENVCIHFLRLIVYLVILFSFTYFVFFLNDKVTKLQKRRALKEIIKSNKIDTDIIQDYIKYGSSLFAGIIDILKIPENELYKKYMASLNYTKSEKNKLNVEQWIFHKGRKNMFIYMLKHSYLKIEKNQIYVNSKKKKTVTRFYQQLLSNNMTRYDGSLIRPEFEL